MKPAPILLFVYNRPWHVKATLAALKKSELANESELLIYADGPKTPLEKVSVDSVRRIISKVDGFKSIKITYRKENLGLGNSIIAGVTQICEESGRVIVLEDDMVVSDQFLRFMNQGLEMYEKEDRVISIHGYIYPVKSKLPETFFIRGADCWGWATWKRGWKLFDADAKGLLEELKNRRMTREFDYRDSHPFTKMLEDQVQGRIDSWAIRWYASAFLREKLTLYPGRSLVRNIGVDGSGTHCVKTDRFRVEFMHEVIDLKRIPTKEDRSVRKEIGKFFRSLQPKLSLASKVRGCIGIGQALIKRKG